MFSAGGAGSIPGQGAKISHVVGTARKKVQAVGIHQARSPPENCAQRELTKPHVPLILLDKYKITG